MIRFHFALRPVEAIEPWGGERRPYLSWFGLSDGWYGLELSGQELFSVAREVAPGERPYVGYQVVRFWEDLLEIVPHVLTAVPADVASHLAEPSRWLSTVERIKADDALDSEFVARGLAWWYARGLFSGHL